LPDVTARAEIFKIHTQNMPLADDVNLEELAKATEGLTGADISSIVKETGMLAVREFISNSMTQEESVEKLSKKDLIITHKMFKDSLAKIHKGSSEDLKNYRNVNDKFKEGEISTFI